MPEQLSKHPEVTLSVLRSAGASCGQGAAQEILTSCPPARFCKLPGGEVCVYGVPEAAQMTQFTSADWASLPRGSISQPRALAAEVPVAQTTTTMGPMVLTAAVCLLFGVVIGVVIGVVWTRIVIARRAKAHDRS